jgi:hypothetical protein
LEASISSKTHKDAYNFFDNSTAMYIHRDLKPYTLAGFEPGIFCSVGEIFNSTRAMPSHLNA